MKALRAIFLSLLVLFTSGMAAWAQPPAGGPAMTVPPPTNLKALPKDLTSDQVLRIMLGWSGDLGVHCIRCHTFASDGSLAPNGRRRLDFANDSRPEMASTRRMVALMDELNKSKNLKAGSVTCGSCHRGSFSPKPFVAPALSSPPAEHGHPHN
jgi:hypothetical protein